MAIRGAGEHTEELLSLGYYNDKFICIFDYSEQKKETKIIAGKEKMCIISCLRGDILLK